MTAHIIHDTAPLGALVRYTDHAPKPPARFTKKLAAWERRNGIGRLVRKEPARQRPTYTSPASITLHEGNFASEGVILVTVMRTHSVDSDLSFEVVEEPRIGMVRVLQQVGENRELLHLAENREAAELWLARNPYAQAVLETYAGRQVGDIAPEAPQQSV